MNSEELARYYQQRKGDLSLWQKTPRPIRRRRGEGPTTSFAVRLTPEEIEELQSAAAQGGVTLSEFIRSSALVAAREGRRASSRSDPGLKLLGRRLKALRASLEDTEKALQSIR